MARYSFVDIPDQKTFEILPTGNYNCSITNLTTRYASDQAKNPGALILRWEFEVINGEHANRKVFDNQTCSPDSLWKVKALFDAIGLDVSAFEYDDEDFTFYLNDDPVELEELLGSTVTVKVGVRPGRKDPNTGKDYDKQNQVNAFFPYEASDEDLMA
jgi:hypothetical protein